MVLVLQLANKMCTVKKKSFLFFINVKSFPTEVYNNPYIFIETGIDDMITGLLLRGLAGGSIHSSDYCLSFIY